MSFNIMDMVKDHIGDQVTGQIGNLLGDQGSQASAGISAAIPALLQGVTARASAPGGADSLFNAVQDHDDGLLDNLGGMLSGNNASQLMESGSGLLSGLMGNSALGTLGTVISSVSGLSKGNTSSLLGLLGPIIFGILKRKVLGDGMGASGLLDMLKGQSSNINAAMPAGLSDQLNTSGFLGSISSFGAESASSTLGSVQNAAGNAVDAAGAAAGNVASAAGNAVDSAASAVGGAADTVTDTVSDAASGGSSMIKKLLPIIGLILLGWLGLKFFGGSGDDIAEGVEGAADSATAAVSSAADSATSAVESATESATETAGNALESAAGALDVDGISSELTGVFDSAKESLGGITDLESAKASLPQLTEMGDKVEGLSGMIEKLPEAARGPLSGIISTGIAAIEPLLETARGLPGVGALIDPIVTPILEKLQGLAG